MAPEIYHVFLVLSKGAVRVKAEVKNNILEGQVLGRDVKLISTLASSVKLGRGQGITIANK